MYIDSHIAVLDIRAIQFPSVFVIKKCIFFLRSVAAIGKNEKGA